MNVERFKNARDLVDKLGDKVWIPCNDPLLKEFALIDEDFEYVYKINYTAFRETQQFITAKEIKIFTDGIGLSEKQKFLLSTEYLQGAANYINRKISTVLDNQSFLRKNSRIDILQQNNGQTLPVYDIDPEKGAYSYSVSDDDFKFVNGKSRIMLEPFVEISSCLMKDYNSISELKIDDFFPNNAILDSENEIYEKIKNKLNEKEILLEDVTIVMAIQTELISLPHMTLLNKKMGFNTFESIGVGIFL